MTPAIEREKDPAASASPDRRRPGRIDAANPDLIALFRLAPPAAAPPEPGSVAAGYADTDLGPARGIGVAIALSLVAWAAVAAGFLLRL